MLVASFRVIYCLAHDSSACRTNLNSAYHEIKVILLTCQFGIKHKTVDISYNILSKESPDSLVEVTILLNRMLASG